jgi:tellurium resistance protein TerD
MRRGANVSFTREIPGLRTVVLGTDWDAGSETVLGENLVTAALLTGHDDRVLSDRHFVFFNQLHSPDLSVAAMAEAVGSDDDQIEIDLPDVPPEVEHVVAVLYVNEGPGPRRTLGQLKRLQLRLLDARDNREIVRSEDLAPGLGAETAIVLGEIYRHTDGWRFKVVGQGYANGLAGVARDFGLTL